MVAEEIQKLAEAVPGLVDQYGNIALGAIQAWGVWGVCSWLCVLGVLAAVGLVLYRVLWGKTPIDDWEEAQWVTAVVYACLLLFMIVGAAVEGPDRVLAIVSSEHWVQVHLVEVLN